MTRDEIMIAVLERRKDAIGRLICLHNEGEVTLNDKVISFYMGVQDGYNQALELLRSSDECNAVELEESK